jgi:hypothetical protein
MSLRAPALAVALALLAASGCRKEDGGVLVQVDVAEDAQANCVRVVARPASGGPEQRTPAMPRASTLKVALYASEALGRDVVVSARGYADCSETALPDEESAPVRVTVPQKGTQTVTLSLERKVVPGDSDGDGFAARQAGGSDCDDQDPFTYPGAPEACGGTGLLDRDCDAKPGCADEDCAGKPCGNDGGCVDQVCQGSLKEVCGDGVDNDADGDVDCLDDDCGNEPCDDGTACTQGERCGVDAAGSRGCIPSTDPGDTVRCTSPPGPCFLGAGTCDPADGSCQYDVNPDKVGASCDDGQACTTGDRCQLDGGCGGAQTVCPAKGACFGAGTCNPADGGCEYPVVLANSCDDGDGCTLGDHCVADGGCEHDDVVSCDAGPCQVSACEKATGACKVTSNRANGLACEDGDKCTFGDACQNGQCAGTPTVCEDGNGCTDNGCNPTTGNCDTAFNSLPCNDNNPCTVGDTCIAGTCTAAPKVCNDNNVCTTDSCNGTSGECAFVPAAVTVKCTDNNLCTGPGGDDFCNGSGGCLAGTPRSCPVADAQCQASSCDTTTGACSPAQGLPNGTPCSDNNLCTGTGGADSCVGGVCTPGAAKSCPVDDAQCQVATCNTATGACGQQNLPDGTVCTDKDLCTGPSGNDSCSTGACLSGAPKDCSDGVTCTTDSCNPSTGACAHAANNASCGDAFSCTVDSCDANAGAGTGCVNLEDDALCTAPTCQAVVACSPADPGAGASGCVFLDEPDGTACPHTAGAPTSGVCVGAGTSPTGAGQAGCILAFPYTPSNFSTGDSNAWPTTSSPLVVPAGCTFTFDTATPALTASGTETDTGAPCAVPQGLEPLHVNQAGTTPVPAALLAVAGLTVDGTLKLEGTTRPALVVVWGDARISGVLNANGTAGAAGPGADTAGCSSVNASTAVTAGDGASGGAGGANASLGGTGGDGEGASSAVTPAGLIPTLASSALKPLYGGCSGGKGGAISGGTSLVSAGGGGGGALQLSVAGKLTLSGRLSAAGGPGEGGKVNRPGTANCQSNDACYGHGGGGGGSGGSLLVESGALVLKANARITANGGGGGGGAKGASLSSSTFSVGDGQVGSGGAVAATTPAPGGAGGDASTSNGGGGGGAGADGATTNAGTAGGADLGGGNQNSAGGGGGGGLGRIRINAWGTTCREASTVSSLATGTSPSVGNAAGFSFTQSGVVGALPAALAAGQSCP